MASGKAGVNLWKYLRYGLSPPMKGHNLRQNRRRKAARCTKRKRVDMATQNDMEMAQHTYRGFIWFVKWGTLAVALIAILVVLLIS